MHQAYPSYVVDNSGATTTWLHGWLSDIARQ
ncbi:hypothetical protein ABIA39_005624 [Nocardia sp. GAS34]